VLLSAALYPQHVTFYASGKYYEEFPTNSSPCAFEIRHTHGKLDIEVRDECLTLGFPPADELVVNLHVTISYHRVDHRFFPEILIPIAGHVEVIPMAPKL